MVIYSLRDKGRRPSGSGGGREAVCAGIVPGGACVPCVPLEEGHGVDPRGRLVCTSLPLRGTDKTRNVSTVEAARTSADPHGVSSAWFMVLSEPTHSPNNNERTYYELKDL
ncbi:hypothetical protein RRG08_047898 [Elysia crispata]|uniref:Uncharacterized protein n=1 Tax=Elysia crispata TaxID=231223 RepID=A0AAE0ZNA2_9GAST|nr:hypothetical protein RRG08_047898 [Elysia crispata]